jgi:hypothetical protein
MVVARFLDRVCFRIGHGRSMTVFDGREEVERSGEERVMCLSRVFLGFL